MSTITLKTFVGNPPPEGTEIVWFRLYKPHLMFDPIEGRVEYMKMELDSDGQRTGTIFPPEDEDDCENSELVIMIQNEEVDPEDAWISLEEFFDAASSL
jgi:hypothetical protein